MAQFVSDNFTDTDAVAITSHTGDVGATWTKHGFATNTSAPTIRSNRLKTDDTGAVNSIYYASGSPASADYTVAIDYIPGSAGPETGDIVGPLGRVATAANTFYGALYLQSAGGIRLYRFVTGTGTVIVAAVAFTPLAGVQYRMTLDMQGTTIAMRVQRSSDSQWLASANTWQASQVNCGSVTDSNITAAGKAGFWTLSQSSNDGQKFRLDAFSADDIAGAGSAIACISNYRRMLAGV